MSGMKYIIVKDVSGCEDFIMFSELLNHADVRRMYLSVLPGCAVVRAGFCYVDPDGKFVCHGKSVSLDMASDPEADARIMNRQSLGY